MQRKVVKNCGKRVMRNTVKSKGHLTFSGGYEYFVRDGEIYKADIDARIEQTGYNKGYRPSRFWATDTPFHRQYAKNQERASREDRKINNPHGFCIVDQHLNKIASGKDYDKLQDRVDRHNEDHDEKWFVIDESDYKEMKTGKKNPTVSVRRISDGRYGLYHGTQLVDYFDTLAQAKKAAKLDAQRYKSEGIESEAVFRPKRGKPKTINPRTTQNSQSRKSLESEYKARYGITGKFTRNDAKKILEIYGIDYRNTDFHALRSDDVRTIHDLGILVGYRHRDTTGKSFARAFYDSLSRKTRKNVSMGFTDSHGVFHPVRASYDYDEDRADENYRPRPVRKYARKEKAFKKKQTRRNAKTLYEIKFYHDKISGWVLHERLVRRDNALMEFREVVQKRPDLSWRLYYGKRIAKEYKPVYGKRRGQNPNVNESELFNIDKIDKLSGIFQGHINGRQIKTVGSDFTPPLTARLGRLAYIKLKNGKEHYEINFKNNGDAWLSADARKNLYLEGKDARIANAATPKKGSLTWLGQVEQINYRTNKSHIENGDLVEYYHQLGEVDGIKPNAFLDHDGFILLTGGNYDIDVHGIEN